MRNIETPDRQSYRRMTTDELRNRFVIEDLFQPGQVNLVYTNTDRAVVGGIVPETEHLELTGGREMACSYFCERREVGIINLGEPGTVVVDGTEHALARRECLYVRRGSRGLLFSSANPQKPACFYLVSYPAHTDYPTVKAGLKDANRIELGTLAESNRRTIYQYIRPGFIRSCQLVMGFTMLHEGSVWNSFPPHTHDRRTEVYCYFDLPPNGAVLHLLGAPDETRHVMLREKQVVLSPAWSVHCGAGTGGYAFVWAMGGENQEFDDMDKCDLASFR
ncbi:MAG TPA: 5-dehydro-4-deoxy-D-glucuronate isomerase [Kiritimatiellia bacterium]|nr:5-dehydro-4-deoxy-D-glucuronate isomerase [Kiritimatiellia bacterium]HOM58412.1 5-dehydro-4-deoxy-D-glucuronate isomerase [Kiritimatiellia bacterium]HOR97278.1 5-dehydro-4-deoxy-D-glucuronate isomerase [Kiritimatiellia bacterium]HPC48562.1 5-dehydro-4-deoxy-D-glucuronate isomerase [Kiritimatiellia bacterium]HPK36645.1 5-dehydro-4-deoxy-D-glucuronate isomerase [Kiritimatiellia bacterium]